MVGRALVVLVVLWLQAMPYTIPAGSLFMQGQDTGFPLSTDDVSRVYSSVDGSTLMDIPSSDFDRSDGASPKVLSNGINAVGLYGADPHTVVIRDSALSIIASVDIASILNANAGNYNFQAIGDNWVDRFYVGGPGGGATPAKFGTVSSAGVIGGMSWQLPVAGLVRLAPNKAETIAYHQGQSSSRNTEIKRWDLVNNVALSDLAARVWTDTSDFTIGMGVTGILVLEDDTILVGYFRRSVSNPATDSFFVRRYSTAGATLNTYTISTADITQAFTMAKSADNLTSFWIMRGQDGTSTSMREIRISDGAILNDLPITLPSGSFHYQSGIGFFITGAPPGPTAPTPVTPLIASSLSCCDPENHSPAGDALLPAVDPAWTPSCVGGGEVPTAAALADSESWDL